MWWKIEDVPQKELEQWVTDVTRVERAAKCDVEAREAGAFVIYRLDDALGYAAGRDAPAGAYVVERWARGKRGWTLYE